MTFLGHYKDGKLQRHLKDDGGKSIIDYHNETNIFEIKGNESFLKFINGSDDQNKKDTIVLFYSHV